CSRWSSFPNRLAETPYYGTVAGKVPGSPWNKNLRDPYAIPVDIRPSLSAIRVRRGDAARPQRRK
ncbi:MAG TPA: hypothetical protein VIK31_02020, partial [Propionibacteriaceae bacterium]